MLDVGDADVRGVRPADGFAPIKDAVLRCTVDHQLTILLGALSTEVVPAMVRAGQTDRLLAAVRELVESVLRAP